MLSVFVAVVLVLLAPALLLGQVPGNKLVHPVVVGDLPSAITTDQFCFVVKEPTNGLSATDHDVASIYSNRARAITITEVWCETDVGTVTLNLQRDDGTPTDILSADLVCDAGEQDSCASGCDVNTIAAAEDNIAVDNEIDLLIASVATSPKRLSLCVVYTID